MNEVLDEAMTDNSLRNAIARAMYEHVNRESEPEDVTPWEVLNRAWKQAYLAQADAVLAVLADLPESVIERAARYTLSQGYGCGDCFEHVYDPCYDTCNRCAALGREFAGALFRAAFGGEQSDE